MECTGHAKTHACTPKSELSTGHAWGGHQAVQQVHIMFERAWRLSSRRNKLIHHCKCQLKHSIGLFRVIRATPAGGREISRGGLQGAATDLDESIAEADDRRGQLRAHDLEGFLNLSLGGILLEQ